MLAVVEDQQHLPRGDVFGDAHDWVLRGIEGQRKFDSDARRHLRDIGQVIECDPGHAVGVARGQLAHRLLDEPALAHAAGSGDGQQPAVGIRKDCPQFLQFAVTSDEAQGRKRRRGGSGALLASGRRPHS